MSKIEIKLNRDEVELRVPEVKNVGHIAWKDGIKVDPEKVHVITNMPELTDIQGVLSFYGLLQYVFKFIPSLFQNHSGNLPKMMLHGTGKRNKLTYLLN